jgi:quercetin dioxygenase-like cupin family protein
LRLTLHEHPHGVETGGCACVVYDVERNEASFGAARVNGPAIVWELGGDGAGAALAADVELDSSRDWIVRCDRVDFPPGAVAHRHVHPGPGIRRLLHGRLVVDAHGVEQTFGPGEAWFEGAEDPVLASAREETAFVRLLLLPRVWAGRRTIRYLDPPDEEKPKLQRATVLLEKALEL